MTFTKRPTLLFLTLATVLLLISACSPTGGTGSGTSGGSNLTVLQLLQNSSKAMSQLKSAHIDLKANGSGQAINTTSTTTPTTGTPATTDTPVTGQVIFNLTGSGDEALPNQETMQFDASQTGAPTAPPSSHIEQIVQGDKVYIKNPQGQWYVLDKAALKGYVDNPFSGINAPDLTELIGLLQNTQITDNGIQVLNGQNLRHITIALDKAALKQFLANSPQLIDLLGQQNINAAIDNTKTFSSAVDLWIDESTAYVHRTELKFNLSVDAASLNQSITPVVNTIAIPSNVTTTLDSVVDLSKFNDPVTITPPTDAIPTSDPTKVFG
ncbi:MAG: hypothetical protein NVS4B7_14270 [Ktedonobacteraceae bacterium]